MTSIAPSTPIAPVKLPASIIAPEISAWENAYRASVDATVLKVQDADPFMTECPAWCTHRDNDSDAANHTVALTDADRWHISSAVRVPLARPAERFGDEVLLSYFDVEVRQAARTPQTPNIAISTFRAGLAVDDGRRFEQIFVLPVAKMRDLVEVLQGAIRLAEPGDF